MRILFLGYTDTTLIPFIQGLGDDVMPLTALVELTEYTRHFDFVVSYGYRHILRRPFLEHFYGRAINLHISYLPWNRGAQPNLWSWIDGTPKGVTIHHIDEGVDTGDIIAQCLVPMGDDETLASSYAKLRLGMDYLFFNTWPTIRTGNTHRARQPPGGTLHRRADRARVADLLTEGWETRVSTLTSQTSR